MNSKSIDRSKKKLLRGVFAPTITAFHTDESINPDGTRQFVRFLLDEGPVDGLTPLGSAGEPIALNASERMKTLEAIVEEVAGRVPIYAGTSDYSTASTLELSRHARSIGCDGLMLMAPFMLSPPKKTCWIISVEYVKSSGFRSWSIMSPFCLALKSRRKRFRHSLWKM